MSLLMNQLRQLAEPFPAKLVKAKPGSYSADYVPHGTVNQRALQIIGPHSFEVGQIIHDRKWDEKGNLHEVVVGVLATLTVEIDGRMVSITEVGTEDNPERGNNGQAAKNAASDAYKRCWMRTGLGLHLWAGDSYFLAAQLDKDADALSGESDERPQQQEGESSVTSPSHGEVSDTDPGRPF